jgi:dolichol-phosphate mannosyltransferase
MPLLSVVTAFYNEELNLPELRRRLEALGRTLAPADEVEFVLVDDHSHDQSEALALAWAREDHRVRYLRLARNAGSHAAFTAGLTQARGDCAVLLAADLQDPPDLVPRLLDRWRTGHDVVWAVRSAREGIPWTTRLSADIYYGLMRRWALPNMPRHGADFLLLDRRVIDALLAIPEKHTSLLGMVLWLGFRQTEIEYTKRARFAGVSKWTLRKKLKLFTDSLLSFSPVPMQAVGLLAASLWVASLALLALLLGGTVLGWPIAGWTWVLLGVLLVGAAQMTGLGILGAYLWRTFDESRRRPRFVIEKTAGLEQAASRKAA